MVKARPYIPGVVFARADMTETVAGKPDNPRLPRNWGRTVYGSLLLLAAVFAIAGLGIWIGYQLSYRAAPPVWGAALSAFLFGTLVGLSEILSRYRDEPLLATATSSGTSYLALNGIISLAAFALLRQYPDQIFPKLQQDLFLTAIVAGFGAMTIFRSKLFTYKSADGKEYAIGPAIVLDTILKMIDSQIDRRRATERQLKVFNAMLGIDDFASVANYIEASLLSFQNLSQDDKTQISTVLEQYRVSKEWPDTLKSLGVGFAFLNVAGEKNFDLVIANLKQYVRSQQTQPKRP